MDIQIDGLEKTVRALDDAGRKQIPFATAKALTMTASDCQKLVRDNMNDHFTVRDEWIKKGIRFKGAKKNDLQAEVGSRDDFMPMHAHGGNKYGRSKALSIPVEGGVRKSQIARIPKSAWPAALLKNYDKASKALMRKKRKNTKRLQPISKRFFIARLPKGDGKHGIWLRTSRKPYPIQLMYIFDHRVRIPKRWPLFKEVEYGAQKTFERNARIALMEALKTADIKRVILL